MNGVESNNVNAAKKNKRVRALLTTLQRKKNSGILNILIIFRKLQWVAFSI
jgi:hypothetical protein